MSEPNTRSRKFRQINLATEKLKTSYRDRINIGYRNKMVKVTLPTITFRELPEDLPKVARG